MKHCWGCMQQKGALYRMTVISFHYKKSETTWLGRNALSDALMLSQDPIAKIHFNYCGRSILSTNRINTKCHLYRSIIHICGNNHEIQLTVKDNDTCTTSTGVHWRKVGPCVCFGVIHLHSVHTRPRITATHRYHMILKHSHTSL